MFAGPQIGSASATARPYSIRSQSLIVMPLIDSPPLDSTIVRGIAFRQRPSKSQKTSIENSSPRQQRLDERGRGRHAARKKSSSSRSFAAEDVARAEAAPRLDEHRERQRRPGSSSGSQLGGDGIPRDSKNVCARYLSAVMRTTSRSGSSTTRAERVARAREQLVVEVGQRHDQAHVVREHEVADRGEVAGVVDARHERVAVGVVERRRERVDVGRDRRRAGAPEGGDDVDALAGAGEEDGGHGRRG